MNPAQACARPFRILSLDGGGIRGAYVAAFLSELERILKTPVGTYFDLIAGTSTGGLIALALAFRLPAQTITEFYLDCGTRIFRRQKPLLLSRVINAFVLPILRLLPHEKEARSFLDHITDVDGLFQAKYDSAELKSALVEVFGGRTLCQATCRLVIPSVNLESGQPVVFKTPHLPDAIENAEYLAVDAALATAAAPTYFPHASNDYGTFGDGGLWANNPSIVGYVEAVRILRDCRMGSTDEIEMLSIGTGRPRIFVLPTSGSKPGVAWWGPRLLDFTGACQSQAAHRHAKFLMGSRYSRINFDVPDESWSMDYVPAVETLVHLGRAAAACEQRLKPTFFTREAEAFIHA